MFIYSHLTHSLNNREELWVFFEFDWCLDMNKKKDEQKETFYEHRELPLRKTRPCTFSSDLEHV